tara:strand:- start:6758 stop:7171 length:414 start_codon:yes stop_codon:yes gene_type:complete
MKNSTIFLLLLAFNFTGCAEISKKDIIYLNGYWEIEEVNSHSEKFIPRGGNVLIDFYAIDSMAGYRKKLAPSLGSKYNSSLNKFNFLIKNIDGNYYLVYREALEPWKEKIKSISQNRLQLEHQDKIYTYRRHKKISL